MLFRSLSFRLEQMKSLKLLSRLVSDLSDFFISGNYPLPSTLTGKTIAGRRQARLSGSGLGVFGNLRT